MLSILIHLEALFPWVALLDTIADFAGPSSGHVRIVCVAGQWTVEIGD